MHTGHGRVELSIGLHGRLNDALKESGQVDGHDWEPACLLEHPAGLMLLQMAMS